MQGHETRKRGAAATGDAEPEARQLSRGVREGCEGVGHERKPSRAPGSDGRRLDLAQEQLELVDRAAETEHERLRAVAMRAHVLERALFLETHQLGGRATETAKRERGGQASFQL